MSQYEEVSKRLDPGAWRALRPLCAVDQAYAEAVTASAQPRAIAVLGGAATAHLVDGRLPVVPRVIPADEGRFGQLMPAWPETEQRPVPIDILDNWGLALFLLRATVGEPPEARERVEVLFGDRSRIRIGVTNDVLQGFVNDPPPTSYSFVRHHALMLFLATLWLPEAQRRGWLEVFDRCSVTLCRECALLESPDPLGWIDRTAGTGASILAEHGPGTRSDGGSAAFLENDETLAPYLCYLGTTSLAVASVAHQYERCSPAERPAWRTRAATVWHAEPDFNTAWILEYLDTVHR